MTTYRNIASSELDADSPIKEQLIIALEKNPRAILEGDPSAQNIAAAAVETNTIPGSAILDNTIQNADMALDTIPHEKLDSGAGLNGAIGQAELSIPLFGFTYTTSSIWNGITFFGQSFRIANGRYMLGWQSFVPIGTTNYMFKIGYAPYQIADMGVYANTWSTWITAGRRSTTAGNVSVTIYYVSASPPYRLPGDGPGANPQDVRRFVFVDVDSDGKIIGSAIGEDPPWMRLDDYPGLQYHPDKITWKKPVLPFDFAEAMADPGKIREYIEARKRGDFVETELTIDEKCSPEKMDRTPHPFATMTGNIHLLDPGHEVTNDLIDLLDAGAAPSDLTDNLRMVGAPPRGLRAPKGSPLIRADWR